MSKVCDVTGKRAMFGNNVSFSINKTRRRFDVNLSKKRFYIPEEDRWITLRVSAKALKSINKKGISVVLKEAKGKGLIK
ncbi:50S ribosomal protein L28 [Arenibacter sp. H213]|uniref:Large ribosomal subunit protein bL28 n=1 Tax=Arenibacter antarcticus TaxID=2040469 RepID=A0ABW5VLX8_9FLAO|nr:50S ribosomal protein L28 [Arenibacter sp. H213]MCM4168665.1 50S ribosomal protein L28 [Arenibacter sp. H213]